MLTVTRRFGENFAVFAAHRMATGAFTAEEIEELRGNIRMDLQPGPDKLRVGHAAIDDAAERRRLWDEFFATEADDIRLMGGAEDWVGPTKGRGESEN